MVLTAVLHGIGNYSPLQTSFVSFHAITKRSLADF